jgi:mediator of RNA polymerase II transcription subunit 22
MVRPAFSLDLTAFNIELVSQVRAAHSLLSIAHSMKLLLLLSDETQIANRRDAELGRVRAEAKAEQAEVAALLDGMLNKDSA